jgi:hypothetical protein
MSKQTLGLLLLFLLSSAQAIGCSCSTVGLATCSGFDNHGMLFVGTVIQIEDPAVDKDVRDTAGNTRYRFRIDEKFSGLEGPEIDIYSGRGGADCSFHFQQGQQYLVNPYANNDGRLFATICSITRSMEFTQALLPQLRARRDNQRVASLYGVLRSSEEPYGSVTDDSLGQPLGHIRIGIRSDNHAFEAMTDSNGVYAFYLVPGDSYTVSADLPENLEIAQTILHEPLPPIQLPKEACYEFDLTALPTGSIQGRVLGPDGKPIAHAPVELFRPDKYPPKKAILRWMEFQDPEKGYFQFTHVAPGDYVLVYNDSGRVSPDDPFPRTYYPNVFDSTKAGQVHVRAGETVTGVDIHLAGGKPIRSITVRLIASAGKLPDIHYVEARGDDGSSPSEDEPSPAVYKIPLFKDVRYNIHAEGYCNATGKQSQTDYIMVDGADEKQTEIILVFGGLGCGE